MSPNKFHDSDVTKGVINGPRSSPLRVKKDSHVIHKPHDGAVKQPVIIYTKSPKVIHTQASDFMSLVQRLTGCTPEECDGGAPAEKVAVKEEPSFDKNGSCSSCNSLGYNQNKGRKVVFADDQRFRNDVKQEAAAAAVPSMYKTSNPYLMEAHGPLFTPSSSEFYCSSMPNGLSPMSPALMEYVKRLTDY